MYYVSLINECFDGNYAVDIHGRVRGGGLAGGLAAYVIVKLAPAIVIVPIAAFLYTGKAIADVRDGPAMGDAYQKTVIDPLYVPTATGIATGPV